MKTRFNKLSFYWRMCRIHSQIKGEADILSITVGFVKLLLFLLLLLLHVEYVTLFFQLFLNYLCLVPVRVYFLKLKSVFIKQKSFIFFIIYLYFTCNFYESIFLRKCDNILKFDKDNWSLLWATFNKLLKQSTLRIVTHYIVH